MLSQMQRCLADENTQKLSNLSLNTSVKSEEIKPKIEQPILTEDISGKFAIISKQINEIIKSMCTECGFSQLMPSTNFNSLQLCTLCNAIFCSECITHVRCIRCGNKVCDEHSVKCIICSRRVCKTKFCISEFINCLQCDSTFCPGHFEQHKKVSQVGTYKLRCESTEAQVNGGLNDKNMQDFAPTLLHSPALLELRLRSEII